MHSCAALPTACGAQRASRACMRLERVRTSTHLGLAILALSIAMLRPAPVHAWAIGSQINEAGCHEPITADALRAVRARFDTAPLLTPSRDEDAMIAAVLFSPPADFVHDLAGMTLLLGVRDNDLKGIN